MKWHKITDGSAKTRSAVSALINQAQVSDIAPLEPGETVLFIDLHTEHPFRGQGDTYRVFPNGAVDRGMPEARRPSSRSTTDDPAYFATMTVRFLHHDPACLEPDVRFESYEEEIVPGVGADKDLRTPEDIYSHLFRHLREEHEFNPGEAAVVSWGLMPNELPRRCGSSLCSSYARPDSEYCDGHDR